MSMLWVGFLLGMSFGMSISTAMWLTVGRRK
jgi:hypothetical protein